MSGDFGVIQPSTLSHITPYEAMFLDLYTRAITLGEFNRAEWTEWAEKCAIPTTPWLENSMPVRAQSSYP